ncbi:ABC transporter [Comamonas thiooxydans]|uniref:Transport permease protein n=1 Tax=Comamonas thiooxydans TaxID=363952 RepID=A0A0E3BEE4_9BURK|nr:ABC transporter permease [Comamonas thiooxydans]KGG92191.1 ABC transporter [Comamonas thiooxydans]
MDSAPSSGDISAPRGSLSVTFAVWNALFLREAVARLSATRGAWVLIVLEPVLHACFMLLLYTVLRTRSVAGADVAVWLVLGLTGYFTVQNVFQRSMGAVSANKALFAYRQVRPIDTVIVRAALETVMGLIILVSILIVLALFGRQIAPEYPMESILSFIGLILSGLGIGLIISVFSDLVPEFASLMNFIFKPLYLLSGAIFPLSVIPIKYREWAFLNPFAHGLELLRSSFFSTYHSAPEANFEYLYSFAIASIFFGLALHLKFSQRLRAQ